MRRTEFKVALSKALASSGIANVDNELVNKIVKIICTEIQIGVSEGRTVSIRGFGTFKPKFYLGNTDSSVFESGTDSTRNKTEHFAKPSFKAGIVLTKQIIKS